MLISVATAAETNRENCMSDWDLLLTDARIATMRDDEPDYGVVDGSAAIAISDGHIVWIGSQSDLQGIARRMNALWLAAGLPRR